MVKEPLAGRVKTRLAHGIGTVAATAAYRAMMTAMVARLSSDPRWRTIIAVSPDHAVHSRRLPRGATRMGQGGGGLGDRMARIFSTLAPGPVVMIGTDIPAITPDDIARAFRALGSNDAVFGPSDDGGYWLIGMKRRPRVLLPFANVRWSSAHALADTQANLANHSVARLRALDDVDTAREFHQQRRLIGRRLKPYNKPVY